MEVRLTEKTSQCWSWFTPTSPGKARCHICKKEYIYVKGLISGLLSHLKTHSETNKNSAKRECQKSEAEKVELTLPKSDDGNSHTDHDIQNEHAYTVPPNAVARVRDRKYTSQLWSWFTTISPGVARCNRCNKEFKYVKGWTRSLHNHMSTHSKMQKSSARKAEKVNPTLEDSNSLAERLLDSNHFLQDDLASTVPLHTVAKTVKKRKKRSLCWSLFTLILPGRARCNICKRECTYVTGCTTSLVRHLKTHSEIEKNSAIIESETGKVESTLPVSENGNSPCTDQPVENDNYLQDEHAYIVNLDKVPIQEARKRSVCWSIFKRLEKNKAMCNCCGSVITTHKDCTSNMKRHIRMKHPRVYSQLRNIELKEEQSKRQLKLAALSRHWQAGPQMLNKTSSEEVHTSRYLATSKEEMPEDLQTLLCGTKEKLGFVPNAYQTMSHRPGELRSFLAYYNAIMAERPGSHLTPKDKEMIFLAVSSFNKCKYFIIAHSGLMRNCSQDPFLAEEIAANWETADIDKRQKSILQFAMKVTKCKALMEQDFLELEDHGLDAEDAWDVGSIASFCSLSNRMAFLTEMKPNQQYHLLGRAQTET